MKKFHPIYASVYCTLQSHSLTENKFTDKLKVDTSELITLDPQSTGVTMCMDSCNDTVI